MKIGIVTYHTAHNYGAMLQAYALQEELLRQGHDPVFVRFQRDFSTRPKYERKKGRGLRSIPRRLMIAATKRWLDRRHANFEAFLHEELRLTRRYSTEDELMADPPTLDAYICGSDQIWNLELGASRVYYLGFAPDGPRLVSYAPSFGRHVVPDDCRDSVGSWLRRFHAISVREQEGCDLVRSLTGREAVRVLDPVFLIDNPTWDALLKLPGSPAPYLAFYSLESSRRTSEIVTRLARHARLPVVVLGKAGGFVLRNRTCLAIDTGPKEFLGWIRNASMVVTNSFHATAFSAKFGVPFATIAHSTRNSRMADLLGRFGLEDRIVQTVSEIDDPGSFFEKPVAVGLDEAVDASRGFLVEALG